MLGRFSRKSFPLRQLREIDPFENHRQPGSGDLDRLGIFGNSRKAKGADFESLVPDDETIAIPVQYFHERVATIEEDEEVVSQRIGFENIANDGEQSVEGLSHIDGRGTERDAGVGRDV